jgi:hypothetical protein
LSNAGITDVAGNALVSGAVESFVADITGPTVSITPVAPDPRNSPVGSIVIVFSVEVKGFDISDLTLTRDGGASLLPDSAALTKGADGRTWTLSNLTGLTGIGGTYTLTLSNAGITDVAGNALVSGAVESFVADITGPTVSITPVAPDPRNGSVGSIVIVFSVEVKGFVLSKLSLVRGSGSNLLSGVATLSKGADGKTWTLGNLSGVTSIEGNYTLTLDAAGVTDLAGNPMSAGTVESFVVDKTAPTVSIVAVSPDPRNTPVDTITIVFSEAVSGFDLGDLTLVMGSGANLLPDSATLTMGADNKTWTLGNLNGLTNTDGTFTLTLTAAGIKDLAGNALGSGATESFAVNVTGLSVVIVPVAPDPRNNSVGSIDIVFTMEVTGLTMANLSLVRGSGANLLPGAATLTRGADGVTWTLGNLSGLTGVNGNYTLTLSAAGIKDVAGHALAAGAVETFAVDVTAPTVVITAVAPDPRTAGVSSIVITFSEAVNGFDMSHLSLLRNKGSNLLPGSTTLTKGADNKTWALANLLGLTGLEGSYALALDAAGITDGGGNALVGAASESFVVDRSGPVASITVVSPDPRNTAVDAITIVFNEPVTGFARLNLSLMRSGSGNLLTAAQPLTIGVDGVTWTLGNLSGLTGLEGSYTLILSATGIADGLGNAMASGTSESFAVDKTAPMVGIVAVNPNPRTTPVTSISIVFSEPVAGFDMSHVSLSRQGGEELLPDSATLTKGADNKRWTLGNLSALTNADGVYAISVSAVGITDLAGNALVTGASGNFTADVTGPTAAISPVTPDPRKSAVSSVVITFSEPVKGGALANLTLTRNGGVIPLTGVATLTKSVDNKTWTLANLTGLTGSEGSYTVWLGVAGITDNAGNAMGNGATAAFTVDKTGPQALILVEGIYEPRNIPADRFFISFTELVNGFGAADLSLTRDGGANLLGPAHTLVQTDANHWTLMNLTELTSVDGRYVFTVNAAGSGIMDLAGNAIAGNSSLVCTVDMTLPTAQIVDIQPEYRTTGIDAVTVTFSERVTGVKWSDFDIVRGGIHVVLNDKVPLTSNGWTMWTLGGLSSLTGEEGGYTVTFTGSGSSIRDSANNGYTGVLADGFVVDRTAPTVSITAVDPDPSHGPVAFVDIAFSDLVVGFDISDLEMSRDGGANLLNGQQSLSTTDQRTYRLSGLSGLTGWLGSYELRLKSSGTGIADRAANGLVAGASERFVVDTIMGTGSMIYLMRDVANANLLNVIVGAQAPYSVVFGALPKIQVKSGGQGIRADELVLEFGNGNMLPAAGVHFDGALGNLLGSLRILGSAQADAITVAPGLATVNGVPIEYSGVSAISADTAGGANTVTVTGNNAATVTVEGNGSDAINVDGGAIALNMNRQMASLSLSNDGRASLNNGVEWLYTRWLSITSGGTLDLNGGGLIVQSDAANRLGVLTQVSDWIKSGRGGGGLWQGSGIISSKARSTAMTGLAVMLNDTINPAGAIFSKFAGQTVDANAILVRHTWDGDGNLDGLVNADDYFLIDSGFITQGKGYQSGDFNYDGVINADDYFLIDSAYIGQSGPLAASKPERASSADLVAMKQPAKKAEPDGILSQLFSTEPVL